MSDPHAVWYLPGAGEQPKGPFTAAQIVQAVRAGKIGAATLCWRDGMPQWLPLGQIAEFAQAVSSAASAPPPGRTPTPPSMPALPTQAVPSPLPGRSSLVRRLVVGLVIVACIAIAGIAGWVYLQESMAIRKANRLIAAGDYQAAARLMKSFAPDAYLFGRKGEYLWVVAAVKQFAADAEKSDPDDLRRPKSQLQTLVDGSESWRELATADLADVLSLIPRIAPDATARGVELADLLQDVKLGEPKELAKELLALVKETAEKGHGNPQRLLDAAAAKAILGRDESLGAELLTLLLPEAEAKRMQFEQGVVTIQRWTGEEPSLAKPLVSAVIQRADALAGAGETQRCERLLGLAERLAPEEREKLAAKRAEWLKKRVGTSDPAEALGALERALAAAPASGSQLAPQFLEVARRLQPISADSARRAVEQAFRLDPEMEKDAQAAMLWLTLHPQPSEEKLRRCQALIQSDAKDAARPQVLMIVVSDAAKLGTGRGNLPDSYRAIAQVAAKELLASSPEAKGFDHDVFALAQTLAATNRANEAIALLEALQKAAPQSPLKVEIAAKIIDWRTKAGKSANAEDDPLVALVDKELKVATLSSPGVIRAIVEDPGAHHVIEVAEGCTADKFRSEEAAMLRKWVSDGGILWVNNNVLGLFDIKYTPRGTMFWNPTCLPGVAANLCPVVKDVEKVTVSGHPNGQVALNLDYRVVYPLLREGNNTTWSLVRYGRGWISDVKYVNTTSYDGAKFWLNFRLFCLGKITLVVKESTGGGGGASPEAMESAVGITEIASTEQLEKALADPAKHRVIWVKLSRNDVGEAAVKKLQGWVDSGGVLWLSTDLASQFGFPLTTAPGSDRTAWAVVARTTLHPVLDGIRAESKIAFEISPDRKLISGVGSELARRMTLILGWPDRTGKRLFVACAIRTQNSGSVVFRPETIDASAGPGSKLNENLRDWSLKASHPSADKAKPSEGESPSAKKATEEKK